VMLVLTWLGIVAVLMAVIPSVALLPILLYIAMLIGAQAFQESPHRHAPAVVIALVPQIAAWGKTQIDSALGAAGLNAEAVGLDKLGQNGVLYHGLAILGSGAVLAGIILGSVTVLIIDRKFYQAAAFALAGAVLTFFGLIHSEAIGVARMPEVAASYAIAAAFLAACARLEGAAASQSHAPIIEHGVGETA
jgi:AGZA family xanthine/uracil permease-like MFS transporter